MGLDRLKNFVNLFRKESDYDEDISKEKLSEQKAYPVPNSNRSLWGGGIVRGLTPEKLAGILDQVRNGDDPAEYLEIAKELEERDAHYRSVLSTRKHAVESLDLYVEPAGDSSKEKEIAEAVEQDIVKHADIKDVIKNSTDAFGKGFAVTENIWDTTGTRWKPGELIFRDPRWFAYDKETGKLCLHEPHGNTLTPLKSPYYIIHEPNLLSGLPITSGLSFTALFYWLIKTYDVTSWAAFADRFGYPVRLGKYGKKASDKDIATLKRAVAAIGSDVGAVIPDSMIIDIVESKTTASNAEVYEKLAGWVDKQLSKLVLGQTATTEGTPGKLGDDKSQQEVRQDILKADVSQLEKTLHRDLTIPYVNFNFGRQEAYPQIKIKYIEPKNISLIVDSIAKLVPLGLKVSETEVRALLGLGTPAEDEEILKPQTPSNFDPVELNSTKQQVSLNASEAALEDEEENPDFKIITDDIVSILEKAADASTNYESFLKEIQSLVTTWPADKIAELISIATFKHRIDGNEEFLK